MATMTNEQGLIASIKVTDGRGRPAQVDGELTSASSDETVATIGPVQQDGPNWMATVSAVAPGTARVVITGDANLDPNVVETITGTLDLEVTLDPRTGARMIEITAGEPTDKA